MRPYCAHEAAVPYTLVTAMAKYCHYCRAWSIWVDLVTWADDENRQTLYHETVGSGPFDDVDDVGGLLDDLLWTALRTPGSPWVSAPALPDLRRDGHRQGRSSDETPDEDWIHGTQLPLELP